jgi:hypothetical protein
MPTIVVDGEEESVLEDDEQTMRPKDVAVQQQRVYAWHPILDPEWVIYSFLILAVVMIPVGTYYYKLRASKPMFHNQVEELMVQCILLFTVNIDRFQIGITFEWRH